MASLSLQQLDRIVRAYSSLCRGEGEVIGKEGYVLTKREIIEALNALGSLLSIETNFYETKNACTDLRIRIELLKRDFAWAHRNERDFVTKIPNYLLPMAASFIPEFIEYKYKYSQFGMNEFEWTLKKEYYQQPPPPVTEQELQIETEQEQIETQILTLINHLDVAGLQRLQSVISAKIQARRT